MRPRPRPRGARRAGFGRKFALAAKWPDSGCVHRHELTDAQWQAVLPLIRRYGRTSKLGYRSFVNAVVYVLKTGAPWRDLPERFGPWKSVSIPLNIAEGGGRNRESPDRARFRTIARGSAMESGALLDVIRLFNVVPQEDWAQAKSLLVRVVEMLSKMC